MYSAVLMLAITTGTDLADFGRRGGCSGYGGGSGCCSSSYYSCSGGCTGYRGGYYGYNYGPSYYMQPGYAYTPGSYYGPNVITQNSAPQIRQSYYLDPNQNFASVRVLLPNPDAEIWFDGVPTQQRGMERFYHSPPLDTSSSYRYTIKARWMENGQAVNKERQVDVRPGQAAFVDFRTKEGEQLQGPRGNNPNQPNPKDAIPKKANPKTNPDSTTTK